MGFWSALTGSDKGSTTEENITTKTNTNQTQTQQGTVGQTSKSTASTLDPQTQALLRNIVTQLGGAVGGQNQDATTIRQLSSQLATSSDPAAVDAQISAAQGEAKRQYNLNEGAQIGVAQQVIGSKGNSASLLLANKGNADLASTLANIATTGKLTANAQEASNLGGAIQGTTAAAGVAAQPLTQFLQSIQALTGTTTTSSTTAQQIYDLVNNLSGNTTQNTAGQVHTSESVANGFLGSLGSLSSSFANIMGGLKQ